MTQIQLTIDGKTVNTEKGKTVLEAAKEAGIHIPTVCAHEDLPHYGACRMCIVEIEGVRGYPTSCTTPAEDGMEVKTTSTEIEQLRNRVMELMMSGHPNACLVCDHREQCEKYRPRPTKAGRTTRCTMCSNRDSCELRDLAIKNQSTDLHLPTLYSGKNVERFDPFMDRDFNLCILCGRCWRICEKIHGKPYIYIVNRGKEAHPGTAFDRGHVHSGCTFCGACVDICPTGTLSDRYARWYGKPDEETISTCTICGQGCIIWSATKADKCIATRMKDFHPESKLCAIGRFAYSQLVNSPTRLRRPVIKEKGELIPVPYEETLAVAANRLREANGKVVVLASDCELRETKYLYQKLGDALGGSVAFVPVNGTLDDAFPETVKADIDGGKFKAAVVAGNFLTDDVCRDLDTVIAIDWTEAPYLRNADAVFPVAVLSEVSGTFRDKDGEVDAVTATSEAPGEAKEEWRVICDIAKALDLDGFDYDSAKDVTPDVGGDRKPKALPSDPREGLSELPATFRGHYIADAVCALEAVGLPMSPPEPPPAGAEAGFHIVDKYEIIPNFHMLEVEAPQVAEYAKPGQFIIVMASENSERTPFTLCDWDAEKGTITMIVEEVGRSSREVANLKKGGRIAHVAGPLGTPMDIEKVGTVALGGGCYGIGAIYPIARAMKEAGNKVISVIEASSHFLLYWEDKMREVSDRLIIMTKDGSRGRKGGVQEAFKRLHSGGEKIEHFVAIGCTFMMRMVSEATQDMGVPTYVALNPIMVDGTGMCGACRVSVAEETKFACVDGPIFNGHDVDWDELFSRRGAYAVIEVEALPQGTQYERAVEKLSDEGHGHGGGCGGHCGGH